MWKRLPRKYKISLTILIICLGLLGYSAWKAQSLSQSSFAGGKGLTLDGPGNIYISAGQCITKYNTDYTFASRFGNCTESSHQLPSKRLAIDQQGNLYNLIYVETVSPHVEKLDSQGKLLLSWGSLGSNDGQFNAPSSIAVDREGMIYVLDSGNARIQKFDSSGRFLTKWDTKKVDAAYTSSNGKEVWEFFSPAVIEADRAGQIYVATKQTIQKFDKDGHLLATLTKSTTGLDVMADMAVDGAGNIYISEADFSIMKLDNKGQFLNEWRANTPNFTSLAVDEQGKVYILANNPPVGAYIQIFDNNGKSLAMIEERSSNLLLWSLAMFFLICLLLVLIPTILIMRLGDKRKLKLANRYYY